MTLTDLYNALTSIQGFSKKVTYRQWPVGESPPLPFICYMVEGTDNFGADNIVYKAIHQINIEFYSKNKDTASEGLIEAKLEALELFWEKSEVYLSDEQCYEIIYTIEVI